MFYSKCVATQVLWHTITMVKITMPDYPIANIFKIQIMFVDNLFESLIVFKHIQRIQQEQTYVVY